MNMLCRPHDVRSLSVDSQSSIHQQQSPIAGALTDLARAAAALVTLLAGFALPLTAAGDARVNEHYGKLPLHFEANQGQTHQDVRFLSRGPGYSLYLTAGEAVVVLSRPNPDDQRSGRGTPEPLDTSAQVQSVALRMSLVGAAPGPRVSGQEELPGKTNYFIGKDPSKWRRDVPTYAKVHYHEVYPGIDLVYYGNQRQLEYDFIVAPGADPERIVLDFQGAEHLEIDAQGDLVLHTAAGPIRQRKPIIYQEIDGVRREVEGGYAVTGTNRVGFQVAAYDADQPLVIDPVLLAYSTYLGGGKNDAGNRIVADADGNAYVAGFTNSTNFPTTPGAVQTISSGSYEVFVTKLNPAGSALVYSTYLSGTAPSQGVSIAIDIDRNAYVTGSAGANFPTTPGALQAISGGLGDAFVAKLNSTGSALLYSTYLGGAGDEGGNGIAVDAAGNAYVTGMTDSTNFPTVNAIQSTYAGTRDAFVAKLNSTGSALIYSTYLGGSGFEGSTGIAVDAGGHAYVTGSTGSTDFPTTVGAFQRVFRGGGDAFVAKLHPAGSVLVYSTYLGGSDADDGRAIAVDANGNAYVTGSTQSGNFPVTAGVFQPVFGGGFDPFCICVAADAFVTKLDPSGSALVYSTYLGGNVGGSGTERGFGIAVDADGHAYVTGHTGSSNFPTTPDAFQTVRSGNDDVFLTQLGPTGSNLVYSTYFGGRLWDKGVGIALDGANNVYVTGQTGFENPSSNDFPTTPLAFQTTYGGVFDVFVAKFAGIWLPAINRNSIDNGKAPSSTTAR
jgi:hypothetical protein